MSSESSISVETAAVNDDAADEAKAEEQSPPSAPAPAPETMKTMKGKKMVRLDDRYVRRLQSLPPIKPPVVPESFFEAFPNLREVMRHADANVRAMMELKADVLRQFREKGFAELDEALLSPPDS